MKHYYGKHTIWFWCLFLIPLVPIALNYLLPLANLSRIGGEDSLQIWLSFWATYSNSLIYSAVTFIVLYIQYKVNQKENNNNRKENNSQNELNRSQNQINFEISQRNAFIPVLTRQCADILSLFDLDYLGRIIKNCKSSQDDLIESIIQYRNNLKNTWNCFLLTILQVKGGVDLIVCLEDKFERMIRLTNILEQLLSISPYNNSKNKYDNLCKDFPEMENYCFYEPKHPELDIIVDYEKKLDINKIQEAMLLFLENYRLNKNEK